MSKERPLQIGDVARKAGVNVQTLRYYERRKLLAPVRRKASGYRIYDEDAVRTIHFIKRAQDLGFTLKEIRELLALKVTARGQCRRVRDRATEKLENVRAKIKMLRKIERTLVKLVKTCESENTSKPCPIIEALGKEKMADADK